MEKYFDSLEPITVLNRDGIEKTAEEKKKQVDSQIMDFIKGIKPDKDKHVYTHVIALGAGEFWGPNSNSDHFPIDDLFADTKEYGHNTFLNAGIFQHHLNKMKDLSLGPVLMSIANPHMKRVELIMRVDKEKTDQFGKEKIWDRLQDGENVGVSMGCFKAGSKVLLSNGIEKNIEEVVVGDYVLSHLGKKRKVTAVLCREYSGPIFCFKPYSHPEIFCTKEHPFLLNKEAEVKFYKKNGFLAWKDEVKVESKWTHASCIENSDYLIAPICVEEKKIEETKENIALARLLGYYLAEGNIVYDEKKSPRAIRLTVHRDDPVMKEIFDLAETLPTKNKPRIHKARNSEFTRVIDISDRNLALSCFNLMGVLAKQKKISEEVFFWPPTLQKHLISAYINGDGNFNKKKGAVTISTASKNLCNQVRHILSRLSIISSQSILTHKAGSGFSKYPTIEYVVGIGKNYVHLLKDTCQKIEEVEVKNPLHKRKKIGGKIYVPIEYSQVKDENCLVYNLEVEEDESYIINGIAVHNCKVPADICSVCSNRAKTRADYCGHMLNSPGKTLSDGRKIFVYNPKPIFFDISFVTNPADKSARVLHKLEEKDGQNCLGSICVVQVPKEFPSKPQKEEKVESATEKTAQEKVTTKKHKPTKVVRQIKYRELPISIEVMSQDYRTGYSKGGMWKKRMHVHYGFINKTEADDGEEVDVYLKPEANKTGDIYVIKQMKTRDGVRSFDEDKVMLGFDSLHHAKSVYLQHMPEKCFGSIEKYSYQDFLTKYLPKYKDTLQKEAQHIIKEAFCHCGSDCCKIAAKKESSNKEADIIKRVPALMTKIPQELLSKIQNKKLCN